MIRISYILSMFLSVSAQLDGGGIELPCTTRGDMYTTNVMLVRENGVIDVKSAPSDSCHTGDILTWGWTLDGASKILNEVYEQLNQEDILVLKNKGLKVNSDDMKIYGPAADECYNAGESAKCLTENEVDDSFGLSRKPEGVELPSNIDEPMRFKFRKEMLKRKVNGRYSVDSLLPDDKKRMHSMLTDFNPVKITRGVKKIIMLKQSSQNDFTFGRYDDKSTAVEWVGTGTMYFHFELGNNKRLRTKCEYNNNQWVCDVSSYDKDRRRLENDHNCFVVDASTTISYSGADSGGYYTFDSDNIQINNNCKATRQFNKYSGVGNCPDNTYAATELVTSYNTTESIYTLSAEETSTCTLCGKGYGREENQCKECTEHGDAWRNNAIDGTECGICPTNSSPDDNHVCRCEAGYKGDDQTGDQTCSPCTEGTYQHLTGQTSCKSCEQGEYQGQTGQTSCKSCGEGMYQDQMGQSACTQCAKGTYQGVEGQSACTPCAEGKYQGEMGKTSCASCGEGTSQGQIGQSTCAQCTEGTYQHLTGQTSCKSCEQGEYQGQTGQTSCKSCGEGMYQNQMGQSACTQCTEGKYQNEMGKTSCTQCTEGKYQGEMGKTLCNECVDGTAAEGATSVNCEVCTYGKFANQNVPHYKCKDCPEDKYSTESGSSICKDCSTFSTDYINSQCCGGSCDNFLNQCETSCSVDV